MDGRSGPCGRPESRAARGGLVPARYPRGSASAGRSGANETARLTWGAFGRRVAAFSTRSRNDGRKPSAWTTSRRSANSDQMSGSRSGDVKTHTLTLDPEDPDPGISVLDSATLRTSSSAFVGASFSTGGIAVVSESLESGPLAERRFS